MTYGMIGVGSIAAAIVSGLSEAAKAPPTILLSPRNGERAAWLASRYANVRVGASNQAVVDGARTLVVALRPQDAREALSALRFSADQSIISVMAGLSIETLGLLVAPATAIARAIPLPAVARAECITPILPPGRAAKALFDQLGGTIELTDQPLFDALSASTATIAAHFAYLGAIGDWLAGRGMPESEAARYVAAMFAGLTVTLQSGRSFDDLARDHATPGGINALFLEYLKQGGLLRSVREGLEQVAEKLSA